MREQYSQVKSERLKAKEKKKLQQEVSERGNPMKPRYCRAEFTTESKLNLEACIGGRHIHDLAEGEIFLQYMRCIGLGERRPNCR